MVASMILYMYNCLQRLMRHMNLIHRDVRERSAKHLQGKELDVNIQRIICAASAIVRGICNMSSMDEPMRWTS
jgi:hypothetical protein